ncbi:kinetochore-associated Ndc80 complex subunit spc25, partial [Elasticomyces elasticus]
LSSRRDEHQQLRDGLKLQIAELQKAIRSRRDAQQQHQRRLDGQARHNMPELSFWESNLCLKIEGAGSEDRLKFVYTHVDERDWEKECWFELSMGGREYEVIACKPRVEKEAVDAVLERLNETRELAGFLKGMRTLFAEAVKG